MPAPLRIRSQPHLGSLSLERLIPFRPSLMLWGVGAGVAVSLFMSPVPIFQKDVLKKIPFVKSYFVDTTPDCDKPF